ncbi:MAG TPA: hypothetical protein VK745_15675 [Polyangiaceae bacterium]|nr:hypothetical protein [Polyangiaceae bacterium]
MKIPEAKRLRDGAAALLLLGGLVVFASVVNQHYPVTHWLFWRYAAYWLCALVCAGASFGLGALTLRKLGVRRLPTLEILSLSFAIGLFEFELAMFLAGACQLYRPALFFVLPLGLLLIGSEELQRLFRRLSQRARLLRVRARPLGVTGLLAVSFGFIGLLAVYFLILSPENVQFDSRWKHLALAEDYVAYGGIRPLREGWVFDSRPHFTSYLFSWAFLLPKSRLFDRMVLSAHLEFVTFLVTTLIGIPALVRRLVPRADPRAVWAARFLFPGVLLYDSSLAVGADHFGAMYGVPICLAALFAWRELSPRWCALLGLLLGAAAMVKETTALLLAPIPVLLVLVRTVQLLLANFRARQSVRPRYDYWRGPLLAAGVGLLCSAPLWLTNWIWHGDPVYPILNHYLHVRPWTSESAYRLKWAYEEANMWQPPHNLSGLLTSLKALATFSFVPNDWARFHGQTPVFGSLFTLLLPCLLLCRSRLRLWGVIGWVHASILFWFWVHHQDRYLQGIMPLMTAATAALVISIWRLGLFASSALSVLIGLQVVWGGDVYFFQTHAMAKSPLKKSIDLLSSGFEHNYDTRFAVQEQFQAVAAALPKHARVVVHDENNHLGLEAQSIMDRFPFEYGISYGLQSTPRAVYDLYRGLGATHILWAPKSKGTDSLAGDIMFFDFMIRRAPIVGSFGGLRLSEMPSTAPTEPFNDTVAVFACPGSYPTGLYRVSDLRVPVYGPQSSEFPAAAPRPMPRDWSAGLAGVASIAATETRCFHDQVKLTQLGFSEAVTRSRPSGTHGQLYGIWFAK